MSEQLPILDELEAARTFSAMAEWLTRCPLAVFASHGHAIEAIAAARGFVDGFRYTQCYVAQVAAVRDGRLAALVEGAPACDVRGELSVKLLARARVLDAAVLVLGRNAVAVLGSRTDLSWHDLGVDAASFDGWAWREIHGQAPKVFGEIDEAVDA